MEVSPELLTGIAMGGGLVMIAAFIVARWIWTTARAHFGDLAKRGMREVLADAVGERHERLGDSEDEAPERGQRRPKTGALQKIVAESLRSELEPVHVEIAEVRQLAEANGRELRRTGAQLDTTAAQVAALADAQRGTSMRLDQVTERAQEHSTRIEAAESKVAGQVARA